MSTAIIVCFGSRTECWNCGGHTHAEDGPFPGDDRYCSEDCYADSQEHSERMARMVSRVTACRSCGLDNFEHLEGCENGSGEVCEGCGSRIPNVHKWPPREACKNGRNGGPT